MTEPSKKRKRHEKRGEIYEAPSSGAESEAENVQDMFRRHFESKFRPLDPLDNLERNKKPATIEKSPEEEDSDWEGLSLSSSSDRDNDAVHIVEDNTIQQPEWKAKSELRRFMSSKPPVSDNKPAVSKEPARNNAEDEANEKLNVKNDLALQRLISESHLLDKAKDGFHSGLRQRVMDSRMQSLGSRSSVFEQQKMPMVHRKGIAAKAQQKEDRRRKEAKENGIILEKPSGSSSTRKKKIESKRIKGIGGPSVGKLNSATLTLSKRDIAGIKEPHEPTRRRKYHRR